MRSGSWRIRLVALSDLLVAILVGVPCAATLYAIRSGRFHNYWVEPNALARTQERGLLLCLACITVGLGLWNFHRCSRWSETLLFIPKLYCAYLFFCLFAISGSWFHLVIAIAVATDAGLVVLVLLWSAKMQATFGVNSRAAE
jgi:hypothetical protein